MVTLTFVGWCLFCLVHPARAFAPAQIHTHHHRLVSSRQHQHQHHAKVLAKSIKRTTILHAGKPTNDEQPPSINLQQIRRLCFNQALVGYSIWTGGQGARVLSSEAHFDASHWYVYLIGTLGVIPLILLSRRIETSESPVVANLNLSTNMLVLRLFGAKPQPIVAFGVSVLLAGLTGVVEETIFRGEALPGLANWSTVTLGAGENGLLYGVVLSTMLFAILHVNPKSFVSGREAIVDAGVLFLLQLCTGGTFCLLYLGTRDLAVPIVAHTLYDLYTFYGTHLEVSSQLAYADARSLLPRGTSTNNNNTEQKWREQRGDEFIESTKQCFYVMDTNRDGVLTRSELRVGMYSFGIRLSEVESERIANGVDVDESGAIDFDEFLEFVGPEGSTSKAIQGSLLGVE